MMRLIFSDVTKSFAERRVIDRVRAEAHSGSITAVTGANGSGKSTLLRLAAKLLLPDEGRVIVKDGEQELRRETYRQRLALVTPDFHVYPKLTARENLDFFLGFRRQVPLKEEEYLSLLQRVGLSAEAVKGKYAGHFSTGMKKRLHMAILLGAGADIWLLDEPGANLDAEGRAMVRREIKKAAAAGRLVLLATNDAEEEAQADACIALSGN